MPDGMVQWICSNDGGQVLCACEYSDVHSDLFQHIKGAALGLLNVEGNLTDCFTTLGDEAALWPVRLNPLLRNGGDGVLARLPTGIVPGCAAIGIGTNKKNRERACALALVVTAGIAGSLPESPQQLDNCVPGLSAVIQAARATFPGANAGRESEAEGPGGAAPAELHVEGAPAYRRLAAPQAAGGATPAELHVEEGRAPAYRRLAGPQAAGHAAPPLRSPCGPGHPIATRGRETLLPLEALQNTPARLDQLHDPEGLMQDFRALQVQLTNEREARWQAELERDRVEMRNNSELMKLEREAVSLERQLAKMERQLCESEGHRAEEAAECQRLRWHLQRMECHSSGGSPRNSRGAPRARPGVDMQPARPGSRARPSCQARPSSRGAPRARPSSRRAPRARPSSREAPRARPGASNLS